MPIFAIAFREQSSVGLEHLPYKQRVGGSTPSAPTRKEIHYGESLFCAYAQHTLKLILSENKADERRKREQPCGCDRLRREVQHSYRTKEAKRQLV